MTSRRPSRSDRQRHKRNLPDITFRHVLAPTPLAPTATRSMERTTYPSNHRPPFGPRRSSSHVSGHISRHDPSDFNEGHRTLAVRPRYPSRAKSSSIGYDTGFRNEVIYCPPPRPMLRSNPVSGSYIGDTFAALDEVSRRAEVYEVPISYASDLDSVRGRSSSAQNSRPSSRGSEYVYTEYEDEEERERKRVSGTEMYGYVMALRLKERLVDVRQVVNLYKEFDRASRGIFIFETQKDFIELIRQAIEAAKEVEKPLRRWAEAGKGKTGRAYYTHKLLETASEVIREWQKRFDWIRNLSDEVLYAHDAKGSSKRQTYGNRREKCMSTVEETSRLLKLMELDDMMEGVHELGERLVGGWRRDGRMSGEEMIRKKGPKWGTRV